MGRAFGKRRLLNLERGLSVKGKKQFLLLEKYVAFLVLFLVLIISNRLTWLCVLEIDMPLFGCWYGSRTNELLLYFMALVLVFLGLVLNKSLAKIYYQIWKTNKWLILFLLFCALSLFWTIDWVKTLYKSILVIISTLVAAYLGVRYRDKQWATIIVIFSISVILLSYFLVLFLPEAAIMDTPQHAGSWRGAFSHRNYMGAIVAYCNVNILLLIIVGKTLRLRILLAVSYLLSWGLIIMSRSATGMILAFLLNAVLLLYLAFLQWGKLLRSQHYTIIVGCLVIVALVIILNSNWAFGLVGRTSTLTGRVPLWIFLFDKVSNHNLLFGYGFGTIWDYLQFRIEAARVLGWPFEIVNSHNGFVDMFVYLGLVGLGMFLVMTFQVVSRVFSFLAKEQTNSSTWALITLVYVFVSNLTISFFFEFETFHWVLFISVLFMASSQKAGSISEST
jgi:O-antigen ligase